MVTFHRNRTDCKISELLSVYEQSIETDRRLRYLHFDENIGFQTAAQDFYQYLSQIFFRTSGAVLAAYSDCGKYVSALRLEPYKDGYLLSGLETAPEHRRKGFARRLVTEVIVHCCEAGISRLYSHIHKQNIPSKDLHISVGFSVIRKDAVLLDGTFSDQYETLCYHCKEKRFL